MAVVLEVRVDILLIEDSPAQALQVQLLLLRAGHAIRIARDGLDGWLSACAAPPQLILLDLELPALDGFAVLTRLKENPATTTIPVVLLSRSTSLRSSPHFWTRNRLPRL